MGLLDILSGNASDGATQGLLGLGAGLLQGSGRGASFGQSLGMGIQNMTQTLAEAERRKQEKAVSDLQAKLLGFKVQDAESDVANQKMTRDRAAAIAAELMAGGNGAPAAAAAPAQSFASAMPGGEGSPRIGGPEWMQSFQQQAPAVATPAPQAAAGPAGDIRAQTADRLLREAEVYARHGDLDGAKQRYAAAVQLQPEFDTKPQIGKGLDGKPFQYIVSKDGQIRRLDGVLPRDEMKIMSLGGRDVAYDPFALQAGQEFKRTASPDALLSANTAMRGQNMTDARARETMDFQRTTSKVPAGYRALPDGSLQAIPGGPADPRAGKDGYQRTQDARDVLSLLDDAAPLLKKATSSYGGAALDQAARVFGASTPGADASAQLKVIQAGLVSKMPKMSGPQSDKDVQLYREAAGQIGDPTLPVSQREAAAKMVRSLNEKYAVGSDGQVQAAPARPAQTLDAKPVANASNKGRTLVEHETGKRYRSNGLQWVEVK